MCIMFTCIQPYVDAVGHIRAIVGHIRISVGRIWIICTPYLEVFKQWQATVAPYSTYPDISGSFSGMFGVCLDMPGICPAAGQMPTYARHMRDVGQAYAGHMSKHMCAGICLACARAHVRQGPASVGPVCAGHMPSLCHAYAVHVLGMCPGI